MSAREQIKAMMAEKILEARGQGLWLRCFYQDMWFSPDELEAAHAKDQFLWGPDNWELRDPLDRLESMRKSATNSLSAYREFAEKLGRPEPEEGK